MEISPIINNAVMVSDIDLFDDEQVKQLGKVCSDNCVVHIDKQTTGQCDRARLYDIHSLWGAPYQSPILKALSEGKLQGRHWRDVVINMARIVSEVPEPYRDMQTSVTYKRNEKNKPVGVFAEGELGWHTDFPAIEDGQRMTSLISLEGTENSITEFLATPKMYQALNHEDKTMVDELITVFRTRPEDMDEHFSGLGKDQRPYTRWSGIPYDGAECPLQMKSASGVDGIRFPFLGFSHFKGMSVKESEKYKEYLWNKLNIQENLYQHHWQDGEIVFFDLDITLHRRPTNVTHGSTRYLVRTCSYLDNLFPGHGRNPIWRFEGEEIDFQKVLELADNHKVTEYEESK
jgi:alpha-ketoglutarate-dependent taurine dioxygenase